MRYISNFIFLMISGTVPVIIPSINTATRVVTFYTSKGVVGSVNWNSFNKVINKLR
jgi:hypothetical protein